VDAIADIIGAVDTPLGLLALVIIGFFALAWKFGKEIISALREIRTEQAAVRAEVDMTKSVAEHVKTSIITNHGSKNIGDAIDRLTGWFQDSEVERAENTQLLQLVAKRLDAHIADCEALRGKARA
jgi:hypothetical protein